MPKYFVSIAEKDSVARARGEFMGTTFFAGHFVGFKPADAKAAAIQQFLTPLDWRALPPDQREAGLTLERLAIVKRNIYNNGNCVVTARLSKAKG